MASVAINMLKVDLTNAFIEYTVEPLYSGHPRTNLKCPLYGGVLCKEVEIFYAYNIIHSIIIMFED